MMRGRAIRRWWVIAAGVIALAAAAAIAWVAFTGDDETRPARVVDLAVSSVRPIDRDDDRLTVLLEESTCYVNPPPVGPRITDVDQQQRPDAIVLRVTVRPERPVDGLCAGSGSGQATTVTLDRPLGDRGLIAVQHDGRYEVIVAPTTASRVASLAERHTFLGRACAQARKVIGAERGTAVRCA